VDEEWVQEHTVYGIRPHLPRTPEEDELERTTAEQWLAGNPVTPEEDKLEREVVEAVARKVIEAVVREATPDQVARLVEALLES
jgi:hypothetical protein